MYSQLSPLKNNFFILSITIIYFLYVCVYANLLF